jgi:hypothetical protein
MDKHGLVENSEQIVNDTGAGKADVYAALNSLVADEYVELETIESRKIELT